MKTAYERWKNGENVYKLPWVIDYYKNVLDFNQYLKGNIVERRLLLLLFPLLVALGIIIGLMLGVFL